MNNYSNTINISGSAFEYANRVTLDNCQSVSGQLTAQMRTDDSLSRGLTNARGLSAERAAQVNLQGALAEVAFYVGVGELLDEPYYHSVGENGPNGKPDASRNGIPIDVKASTYPNLLVPERHLTPDSVYAAVQVVSSVEYDLNGWITGKEILAHPEWKKAPNGRTPCFIVPKSALRPFRKFVGEQVQDDSW